jgi:hypothetical protein
MCWDTEAQGFLIVYGEMGPEQHDLNWLPSKQVISVQRNNINMV